MADATAPAASSEAAAEKKELTREQLLLYIKKLKVRVKDLEGQVESAKQQQAALQSQQLVLEEEAGALRTGDEAMQARLVEAAEQIHAAERDGKAKVHVCAFVRHVRRDGAQSHLYVPSESNPINTSLQPKISRKRHVRSTP